MGCYVFCLVGWVFFLACHKACGILVPWPVTETGPWTWRCWVLTTGPPWNSQTGCKVAFPQVVLMLTVLLWHWKHTTSCHHYPDIRLILRQTGWITSRNQDCQGKYQQLQVCRWYHSSGRKWRWTKEPLNEGESRKWKKLAWNSTIKKLRPCNSVPSLQVKRGKSGSNDRVSFLGLQNHCGWWLQPWN